MNGIVFCQQHSSLPILKLEYTGSVYERLKTEAADEVDVMVVLRTKRREIGVIESGISWYVCLKARDDSLFGKYASREVYIDPVRLWDGWFYSLVLRFLRALQIYLERRNLPHNWISGVNLVDDINEEVTPEIWRIVFKQSLIATQKGIKFFLEKKDRSVETLRILLFTLLCV